MGRARSSDSVVIDDEFLARLSADRDSAADPAQAEQLGLVLDFLARRTGATLGQARAELEAEMHTTKADLGKLDAILAAAEAGIYRVKDPAPLSGAFYSVPGAPAPLTPVTASQVLDHHARLHDTLARPTPLAIGLTRYFGELADQEAAKGSGAEDMLWPYYVGGQRPRDDWEAKFLVHLARGLISAPTYQVTAPMCEIAEAMYEQTATASGHLESCDIPSESGFLWLDKPFTRTDADGAAYQTRVVTWSPQSVRRDGTPQDGVRITLWADWASEGLVPPDRLAFWSTAFGPLSMAMTCVLPFGANFEGMRGEDKMPAPLHYVHAVWLLLGTEVAAASRGAPSRPARKRALRSIRHDQVTVITLRRGTHADDREPGHREIDWSCRWIVRGFWRHHQGYGTTGHPHEGRSDGRDHCLACGARISWVRPYVKGPDDRPLKATQTLYRLSR